MPNIKVFILTRKGNVHEIEVVKQIEKAVVTGAQIASKQVDIEVTTDFTKFEGVSMNIAKTPILIINKVAEFSGKPPPVDLIRQCLVKNDGMPPAM